MISEIEFFQVFKILIKTNNNLVEFVGILREEQNKDEILKQLTKAIKKDFKENFKTLSKNTKIENIMDSEARILFP